MARQERIIPKLLPISFRPTSKDREAIAAIRAGVPRLASDADAIRHGLAMGVDVLNELGHVSRATAERLAKRAAKKEAKK